jgi:ribosomal protein S18 acetylase RimI-like enzyme
MDPSLHLTDKPDPQLRDVITANFNAHAATLGIPSDFRDLAIELRRDGVLLGGLQGKTGRGWLYIELLALPMTEQGGRVGSRLMAMAEAEAVRRGCHGAYLYTAAFQAPGFYQKLGYQEFSRLVHDDPRLTRIWFSKRLP